MLVSAYLAQHNGGMTGHDARTPVSTILRRGSNQALVAAFLSRHFGNSTGQHPAAPAPTVTAGGAGKTALVAAALSHNYSSNTNSGDGRLTRPHKTVTTGGHHALVAAFLAKYYGQGGQWQSPADPMHTIPSRDRLGLVTVTIDGATYVLEDIGMRMLTPRELYTAQGFPADYVIDPLVGGKRLSKTAQIRMCGNSVCPQVAEAVVRAQPRRTRPRPRRVTGPASIAAFRTVPRNTRPRNRHDPQGRPRPQDGLALALRLASAARPHRPESRPARPPRGRAAARRGAMAPPQGAHGPLLEGRRRLRRPPRPRPSPIRRSGRPIKGAAHPYRPLPATLPRWTRPEIRA